MGANEFRWMAMALACHLSVVNAQSACLKNKILRNSPCSLQQRLSSMVGIGSPRINRFRNRF
jgi:hypothetical protein